MPKDHLLESPNSLLKGPCTVIILQLPIGVLAERGSCAPVHTTGHRQGTHKNQQSKNKRLKIDTILQPTGPLRYVFIGYMEVVAFPKIVQTLRTGSTQTSGKGLTFVKAAGPENHRLISLTGPLQPAFWEIVHSSMVHGEPAWVRDAAHARPVQSIRHRRPTRMADGSTRSTSRSGSKVLSSSP